MDGLTDGADDEWMDQQMDRWMGRWMDGWMARTLPKEITLADIFFEVESREAHSETAASNPVISFVAD